LRPTRFGCSKNRKASTARAKPLFLLGHETLKSKLSPQTLNRLSSIKLSVEAVTEMDLWVNVDGLTPREAAKKWLSTIPLQKM
jgi:hypothetical protein